MCKELQKMGFDTICLKDMAGTMSPKEAEELFKGIKDAGVTLPLILHTHCTTGMAYMTIMKAIESGVDIIRYRYLLLLQRHQPARYREHLLCSDPDGH